MTDFVKFVKKHIKAGKTVYRVSAFPFQKEAFVSALRVKAKPTTKRAGLISMNSFAALDENQELRQVSLKDVHRLGSPRYNFHRLFSSKKKAFAYAALVKAGTEIRSIFGYSAEEMTELFDRNQERRADGFFFEAYHKPVTETAPKSIRVLLPQGPTPRVLPGVSEGIYPIRSMSYQRAASR